ncbi:MAG: sulfite exporter TauE/SafE family protein [Syntrophales bacterium]|nr:sulfite exporter TauE/SafE family protein [Syntrophales bacterium]
MGKVKWLGKGAVILFILSLALLTTAMFTAVAQEKPKAEPSKIEAATPGQGAVVGSNLGLGGKLGAAVAKTPAGKGNGQIDVSAPRGAFGIPGAPDISYLLAIIWAVWVGWIFSTVGAFGGIMAGVGHMTIYGLGDYAKSFRTTNPALNKTLTDSIRTSNQFLVGLSALISMINFLKAKRLAWPLGIALALGSVAGAIFIPMLTGGRISLRAYQGWFGLFVFLVGAFMVYELTPKGQAKKKSSKAAAQAFEKSVKEKKDLATQGITLKKFTLAKSTFTFFGADFDFSPIWAFVGGLVIAAISSFLGVGGGFLYVPYLTSLVGAPMYVVAGTSAMAVFISMLTSITGYITVAKAGMDWGLIGIELVGIFVGSMIGPRTQKYIPDKWLKIIFIILAAYVGLRYFSAGFFGQSWVP